MLSYPRKRGLLQLYANDNTLGVSCCYILAKEDFYNIRLSCGADADFLLLYPRKRGLLQLTRKSSVMPTLRCYILAKEDFYNTNEVSVSKITVKLLYPRKRGLLQLPMMSSSLSLLSCCYILAKEDFYNGIRILAGLSYDVVISSQKRTSTTNFGWEVDDYAVVLLYPRKRGLLQRLGNKASHKVKEKLLYPRKRGLLQQWKLSRQATAYPVVISSQKRTSTTA